MSVIGLREMLCDIYAHHRRGLFALAMAIVRDSPGAEDAVHDAFARLLASGARPSGDPVAYVFAVVRNAARDQLRMRPVALKMQATQSLFGLPQRGPEGEAQLAEERQIICRAVDDLGDEDRQVIVMKIYGGLTFDQIATACSQPLATVASRYRRALEKLRQALPADQLG